MSAQNQRPLEACRLLPDREVFFRRTDRLDRLRPSDRFSGTVLALPRCGTDQWAVPLIKNRMFCKYLRRETRNP
ncbi:MAG: hypothetical protein CSA23_03910 [Deltaproteobacteria bacterium]|nr:MAG: hypothetical protein CSA23_03910 [Deltaproteobacteria bacterium]